MLVISTNAWLSRRLRSELIKAHPRAVHAPLCAGDWTGTEAAIRTQAHAPVPVLILVTWADFVDRGIPNVLRAVDDCIARMRSRTAQAAVITVGLVPYGSYSDGSRSMQEYPSVEPLEPSMAAPDITACVLSRSEQWTPRHDLVVCPMVLLPTGRGSKQHPSALQAAIRIGRGLADETRAKVPSYFSRYPLTLCADAGLDVNASSAGRIAEWLTDCCVGAVERPTESVGRVVFLHSRVSWPTVCAASHEGGVPLAIGKLGQPLNALDTLFNELVYDEYHHRGAAVHMKGRSEVQVRDLDSMHVPTILRVIASSRCREWESSYDDIGALRELDLDHVAALHSRELYRRASPSPEPDDAATPVRYREGGAGDVVLFLPPLGIGIEYYKPALESLLHDFRVIVWHPRAKSVSNARSWIREELSRHIDDIRLVLEREHVSKCHLVTWCGGARLIPKLLDVRELQIQSLALMAPLLGGRDVFTRQAENVESVCRQLVDGSMDVDRFLRQAKRRVREAPSALDQYAATEEARRSPLEYHPAGSFTEEMFNDVEATKDWAAATLENVADMATAQERLRTFDGPMLFILGRHDALIRYDCAKRLVGTMRHAVLATVHGGNHYFLVEHGRAVTNVLRTFMRTGSIGNIGSRLYHGARIRIDAYRERLATPTSPAVVAAGGKA